MEANPVFTIFFSFFLLSFAAIPHLETWQLYAYLQEILMLIYLFTPNMKSLRYLPFDVTYILYTIGHFFFPKFIWDCSTISDPQCVELPGMYDYSMKILAFIPYSFIWEVYIEAKLTFSIFQNKSFESFHSLFKIIKCLQFVCYYFLMLKQMLIWALLSYITCKYILWIILIQEI